MPNVYTTKFDRNVDSSRGNLFGMKSHDCHVFIECLLLIAFIDFSRTLQSLITKLSQYFKNLCSLTLCESELH